MLEITLSLDEKAIISKATAAANDAATRLFAGPSPYTGPGGEGYQHIEKVAMRFIAEFDFSEMIKKEAESMLRDVVRQAVRAALKAEVKKQVSELKQSGSLLSLGDSKDD